MEQGAIYVDDSGNPGADSGSDFLPPSRKSWTAVIVPSPVAGRVATAMGLLLDGVREEFGATELHFTEIFSGKGPWAGITPARRGEMIRITAGLMGAFALPVVHRTVSAQTLDDHVEMRRDLENARAGDWRLDDVAELGLLMLCSEVSSQILALRAKDPVAFGQPLPLHVDEGVLPAGGERRLPNWASEIEGPTARFGNSAHIPGLQLADFAAFVITRSQWAIVKRRPGPELGESEEVILRAAAKLNVLNLPMRRTTAMELGRDSYERWMAADREAKGLKRRPTDET